MAFETHCLTCNRHQLQPLEFWISIEVFLIPRCCKKKRFRVNYVDDIPSWQLQTNECKCCYVL